MPAYRLSVLVLTTVALLLLWPGLARADDALGAGQEGPLVVPGCSHNGVVYVPSDYKSDTPCGLILFMHGSGGSPTTWPFKSATQGVGYIVCGLSYGAFPDAGAGGISSDPPNCVLMCGFIDKVRAQLSHSYNIDQKRVILSGLSMGGWAVNFYGFQTSQKGRYCAYAIIAAGAVDHEDDLTVASGLPVLVLNGEKCFNLPQANAGMPLLTKVGAIATQVVLPGQAHVPSEESITPPLKAWLKQVEQTAQREEAMVAVHWRTITLAGEVEHSGDTKTILTHYFAHQDGLGAFQTTAPTLIFLSVHPPADPDAISRHALDSALVQGADFSYPAATALPVVAHHFTTVMIDVSDLDPAVNRMINRDSAPAVILLDKDHACTAYLKGRGQLAESSLLGAMRKLLPASELTAVDATVAEITPKLKTMRTLQKKLTTLSSQLSAARADGAATAGATSHQDALSHDLDACQQQYQDLGVEVGKAVNPAP